MAKQTGTFSLRKKSILVEKSQFAFPQQSVAAKRYGQCSGHPTNIR